MTNFILSNVPYFPDKVLIISNFVYLESEDGKVSIGIDRKDLEDWLKEMKKNEQRR
jgi:hypothetical protein